MIMDMINWHKTLNGKKITLFYSGPLWPAGIGEIAGTLKKHLELDDIPLRTSQEVFSVFVEQLNNMLMYSAEKIIFESTDKNQSQTMQNKILESSKGTFILGKESDTYFIQTGNVMKKETVSLVKNRIDYLNTLNKQEVRKYFKEQMKLEDENPESKGAGLGFIEIARRISSKIEYSFTDYDEGLCFFTLYVTIKGKENE